MKVTDLSQYTINRRIIQCEMFCSIQKAWKTSLHFFGSGLKLFLICLLRLILGKQD